MNSSPSINVRYSLKPYDIQYLVDYCCLRAETQKTYSNSSHTVNQGSKNQKNIKQHIKDSLVWLKIQSDNLWCSCKWKAEALSALMKHIDEDIYVV